jgi:hypothetical protein
VPIQILAVCLRRASSGASSDDQYKMHRGYWALHASMDPAGGTGVKEGPDGVLWPRPPQYRPWGSKGTLPYTLACTVKSRSGLAWTPK